MKTPPNSSLQTRSSFHSIVIIALTLLVSNCVSVAVNKNTPPSSLSTLPFPGYEQLTEREQVLADSIIGHALDHEALYSLMGDLKPISSIGFALSYPLGKDSLQFDGEHFVVNAQDDSTQLTLDEIESWNRILEALSFDNYRFLLVPFKRVWDGDRNMQILVCRTDLLDKLLETHSPFFSQWGFVPGSDPAVVLTTTEFEERNDRYRAYGYLFGYPKHAVDFFVDASIQQQETGEFVKRSFFNIPVFAKERGYFTYAVPEDYEPAAVDSLILQEAALVLEEYQSIRPTYVDKEEKLEAVRLFREWWMSTRK